MKDGDCSNGQRKSNEPMCNWWNFHFFDRHKLQSTCSKYLLSNKTSTNIAEEVDSHPYRRTNKSSTLLWLPLHKRPWEVSYPTIKLENSHKNSKPCWSHSWREFSFASKSFDRFYHCQREHFGHALSNLCIKITLQIETWDKAFGFLLVYNCFSQLSTFLSIGSELDTGLALFCF